jgi:hypothetical protein
VHSQQGRDLGKIIDLGLSFTLGSRLELEQPEKLYFRDRVAQLGTYNDCLSAFGHVAYGRSIIDHYVYHFHGWREGSFVFGPLSLSAGAFLRLSSQAPSGTTLRRFLCSGSDKFIPCPARPSSCTMLDTGPACWQQRPCSDRASCPD